MQMKWTILIRYEGPGAGDELQEIGKFERPADRAAAADFGLSRAEGQTLLANLVLDWFHIGMKLKAVLGPVSARCWVPRPEILVRCEKLARKVRDALWRGRGPQAIELLRTLKASLEQAVPNLDRFFSSCADTSARAAQRLLEFVSNNRKNLIDYAKARQQGRRISSASAEPVMNHVINRRMSKKQQMRWRTFSTANAGRDARRTLGRSLQGNVSAFPITRARSALRSGGPPVLFHSQGLRNSTTAVPAVHLRTRTELPAHGRTAVPALVRPAAPPDA